MITSFHHKLKVKIIKTSKKLLIKKYPIKNINKESGGKVLIQDMIHGKKKIVFLVVI